VPREQANGCGEAATHPLPLPATRLRRLESSVGRWLKSHCPLSREGVHRSSGYGYGFERHFV
jgi:hypothetical protein